MMFAKFDSLQLGRFWIELEGGEYQQGVAWAQGVEFGSRGRLKLADTRLSRHPSERTLTKEQVLELLSTGEN